MTVSPSHAHVSSRIFSDTVMAYRILLHQAFVALSNGEIKTYDTLCLRMSPYTVPPNLWTLYEQKVEAAGMPALPTPGSYVYTIGCDVDFRANMLIRAYQGSDHRPCDSSQRLELVVHCIWRWRLMTFALCNQHSSHSSQGA